MQIAVASGKGGTGKTTVATCLAESLAEYRLEAKVNSPPPLFLDCDVEAPNAHLFLEPTFDRYREVGIPVPEVDDALCTYCGRCAEVCQYQAIAILGKNVLVFPQLCHGCGSCARFCPENAITEVQMAIGVLQAGQAKAGISFSRGVLHIGQPMASPVIRELRRWATPKDSQVVILDVPPGTSCPVVDSIHGVDFLLLVTEPTPFGLHDLRLAVQVARVLELPVGVVVNRDGIGDSRVDEYCSDQELPIMMRIPYGRDIAEGIARGKTLVEIRPQFKDSFQALVATLMEREARGSP